MEKLIITAAICGAETTRQDNPNLPLTASELAEAAVEAEKAGASIIHLHVRDHDGRATQDIEHFSRAIDAMKETGVSAIIQPSTGGATGMTWEERLQPVNLDPEMATLDCGTVNFGDEVFVNDVPLMRRFAREMKDRNILPELECFDAGNIYNALKLEREGLLPEHLHFGIVLGVPGALAASVKNLLFMVELLPDGATWTAAGIGRWQLPVAMHTILMGGHVRVGFEDSVQYSKGEPAESNAQLVSRVVRIAGEVGREVASPSEARRILDIGKGRR
ncbi:MAG: 3-keto-5-aminohexanoate cleavage protein [Spirochaetales bacterium]|nr:3-keto-5-aminohexanoate cleavage protein [Spirochaetales bacterium]